MHIKFHNNHNDVEFETNLDVVPNPGKKKDKFHRETISLDYCKDCPDNFHEDPSCPPLYFVEWRSFHFDENGNQEIVLYVESIDRSY